MASSVHAIASLSTDKPRDYEPFSKSTTNRRRHKKPNSCIYAYGSINYSLSSNHLCSHQTWWNIGNMTYLRLPCCVHYTLFSRVSKFSCNCILACLCAICTLHLLPTTFLSLQYCCSKWSLLNLHLSSEYHTLTRVQCKWCVASRRVYTSK